MAGEWICGPVAVVSQEWGRQDLPLCLLHSMGSETSRFLWASVYPHEKCQVQWSLKPLARVVCSGGYSRSLEWERPEGTPPSSCTLQSGLAVSVLRGLLALLCFCCRPANAEGSSTICRRGWCQSPFCGPRVRLFSRGLGAPLPVCAHSLASAHAGSRQAASTPVDPENLCVVSCLPPKAEQAETTLLFLSRG